MGGSDSFLVPFDLTALNDGAGMALDSGNLALFGGAVLILATMLGATYGPPSALYAEMFAV